MNETTQPANGQQAEVTYRKAVVCFFIKNDPGAGWLVHLAVKKEKIGKGFRNGYGGKRRPGESPRQCARREIPEETVGGIIIRPEKLRYAGLGRFLTDNEDGTKTHCEVNIFLAEEWSGDEFFPSLEMDDGKWYPINALPLRELMPGDREWLPIILKNNINGMAKFYEVRALHGPGQRSLLGPVTVQEIPQMYTD